MNLHAIICQSEWTFDAKCMKIRKFRTKISNPQMKSVLTLLLQIGEWSPTGGVYSHLDDEQSTSNVSIGGKVYLVTSIEVFYSFFLNLKLIN